MPISPLLYCSSALATLKISRRYGFFLPLLFLSLSLKKLDSASVVASSSLATVMLSFLMSACWVALGSMIILNM